MIELKGLTAEVDSNFEKFSDASWTDSKKVRAKLDEKIEVFRDSYRSLVSLQAWRVELLAPTIDAGALEFFLEAQNDGLVSHVSARNGQWRLALKSLRSVIEGVLNSLYYKDHPVELELWNRGEFRIGFTELSKYFEKHPLNNSVPNKLNGVNVLAAEYATLSKAVHGSAKTFRMSAEDSPLLWNADFANVGKWRTRERTVLLGINLVLLMMFHSYLDGAKNKNLRKAMSLLIESKTKKSEIKKTFGVHLF